MLTINEIIRRCTETVNAPQAVPDNGSNLQADESLPFWVVVVNPRRQPPVPKFHSGHATTKAAEVEAQRQQQANDKAVEKKTGQSFRFFVASKPNGGHL